MNSSTEQPNILLIHADQMRGDCLGLENHPDLHTPQLDYLAQRGTRFTRAYTECPICIPARHVLMTGMEPAASGVVGFATRTRIARPDATLPALLRDAGYQTALVGRNMHTYPKRVRYGFEVYEPEPLDEYYSRFHQLQRPSSHPSFNLSWPHYLQHGLEGNSYVSRAWPFDEEFHQTNFAVNKAMQFLDTRDPESPFFLAVGFVAPHPPLCPPADYLNRYLSRDLAPPVIGDWATRPEDNGLGLSPGGGKQVLEGEKAKMAQAGYYGLINHIDDQLFLLLRRVQQETNTIILFLSDHGEMLGDHYFFRKSCPYEGSARIPLIIQGPGIEGGLTPDAPVGLQDILPTCCELAGAEIPEHVTGQSLVPFLKGSKPDTWRERLHAEHFPMSDQHPGWHSLNDGRYKYIWFNDGHEQFFDLHMDPRECRDLQSQPEARELMNAFRQDLLQRLKDRPEGFSDGTNLIPNRPYAAAMPHTVTDEVTA
jgi:arylsulfatase A-like enzyme